jgi:hypothetical protein
MLRTKEVGAAREAKRDVMGHLETIIRNSDSVALRMTAKTAFARLEWLRGMKQ